MGHRKIALLGALTLLVPGHDMPQERRDPQAPSILRRRERLDVLPPAPNEADQYYQRLTASMNPRLALYEEKNPLIIVAEKDKGDHKAEVIRVIESTFGKDNPPRIVYLDSNLLDESAALSLDDLLARQGVSASSARAINFSMGAWFDSTTPTAALAMRRNIAAFRDTVFVHAAGNMAGLQPVFGLTTQSDHCLVVGATGHSRHERPTRTIRETDFTASSESVSSAVDLVMKGENVPVDGISGLWSQDRKEDPALRHITGTSFAAPQVTAAAAKISARLRDLHIRGLPGRRFKQELTQESIAAKDQRVESFPGLVTASLLASADAIDPGVAGAVVSAPDQRRFDTMGSGFGMPDFGLAERVAFDQMMAAQLSGRVIPESRYQAYAPENSQSYPRVAFDSAREENAAIRRDMLRYTAPIRVPIRLKTSPVKGEPDALAIDIPPFKEELAAQLVRGSVLIKIEDRKKGAPEPAPCELFLESGDGKLRIPLGGFTPSPKEMLWHEDKPHPIDQFRIVNFRTRGFTQGSIAQGSNGARLIIKSKGGDIGQLGVYGSGDTMLPVLEVVGAPRKQDMFSHHPAEASRLGFLSQDTIVESYKAAFERLEDRLDSHKPAQQALEDFIEGRKVTAKRLLDVLPVLSKHCGTDAEMHKALGLMLHYCVVEPAGRGCAERMMHLASHYEQNNDTALSKATDAYSNLYTKVLEFERALVSGRCSELPTLAERIAQHVRSEATLLAAYAESAPRLFPKPWLAAQEQEAAQALYHDLTGEKLPASAMPKAGQRAR